MEDHREALWGQADEGGDFVGFGQSGIVEGVFNEIFKGTLQVDHCLSDVDKLSRPFAHDVAA